jgi:hypothetical protein
VGVFSSLYVLSVELGACSVVNSKCRWNSLGAQYIIIVFGGIVCVCLVVYCNCLWICGSIQEFIMIVGEIVFVFSSLL